ncbi:MAG: hypothetical protein SFW09_03830 [Hyphomicrobiaceae bacterium]|nr:hypothetical protein [Hyphomicrobiaceae bacterium]
MGRQGARPDAPALLAGARLLAGLFLVVALTSRQASSLAAALFVMAALEGLTLLHWSLARQGPPGNDGLAEPLSGSIYRLTVSAAFLANGWLPAWMLIVIFARDLVVPYLRAAVRQRSQDLTAGLGDRLAAVAHAVAQLGVVAMAFEDWGPGLGPQGPLAFTLLVVAVAFSAWSLVEHFARSAQMLKS